MWFTVPFDALRAERVLAGDAGEAVEAVVGESGRANADFQLKFKYLFKNIFAHTYLCALPSSCLAFRSEAGHGGSPAFGKIEK